MEFGENLRRAREAKGMTQQSLADQLYVTRQAVSRWECGARYPDLMTTKCVSDILGVSVDQLLSAGEAENFVRKQPVLESRRAEKVHFGLFLMLAVLGVILLTRHVMELCIALGGPEETVPALWLTAGRMLVLYSVYAGLGIVGMWKLWQCEATPVTSELTGSVFFAVNGLDSIIQGGVVLSTLGYYPAVNVVLALIDWVIALCIIHYFRSGGKPYTLYAAGTIWMCFQIAVASYNGMNLLRGGFEEIWAATFWQDILLLAVRAAAVLVLFYQIRLMERKRRRFQL